MAIDIRKLEEGREIFKKISQSKEIRDRFKFLIERQHSENREHGIGICSKNNSLIITSPCIEVSCKTPPKCPENSKLVADFHTHPKRSKPTEEDIGKSIDRKLSVSCIGAIDNNRKITTCYYPYFHKRRIFAEYIGSLIG